jgi:hypothetical protein
MVPENADSPLIGIQPDIVIAPAKIGLVQIPDQ